MCVLENLSSIPLNQVSKFMNHIMENLLHFSYFQVVGRAT